MKKSLMALLMVMISIIVCAEEKGNLKVTVEKFEKMKGCLKIAVFNSEDGFPSDISKSITTASIKVGETKITKVFDNLPLGEYGVTVYYDENSNDKLDTGMFGMPKEAVGTSNNPKPRMGPPLYKDAKFMLEEKGKEIIIKLNPVSK